MQGGLDHIGEVGLQPLKGLKTGLEIACPHEEAVTVEMPFGIGTPLALQHVHHAERPIEVSLCGAQVEEHPGRAFVFGLVLQHPLEGVVRLVIQPQFEGDVGPFGVVPRVVPVQRIGFEDGRVGSAPLLRFPLEAGEFIMDDGFIRVGIEAGKKGLLRAFPVSFQFGHLRLVEGVVEGAIDTTQSRFVRFAGASNQRTAAQQGQRAAPQGGAQEREGTQGHRISQ